MVPPANGWPPLRPSAKARSTITLPRCLTKSPWAPTASVPAGIEAPIRFYLVENADGSTTLAYKKPSMVFAISKNAKDPEAAAQIVNCLLNEPEGIEALGTSRGLPASRVAAELLAGQGEPEVRAANAIVLESTGPVVSPFNEHPEIRGLFIDTLEEYAYGQIDAQGAAEQIIDGTNDVLANFD